MSGRGQRAKVGELRPSQLLFTFGVGATIELPYLSVIVMGTDDWSTAHCQELHETRLLQAVQEVLGKNVAQILTPPRGEEEGPVIAGADPGSRIGVPVAAFPRWVRCPVCDMLAPLRSGLFQLKTNPYRPDQSRYVHVNCLKARTPPPVLPARFLAACPRGHLDDFPWHEYLHDGEPCNGLLMLREMGPAGTIASMLLVCDRCQKRKTMAGAFDTDPDRAASLPPCRGRRPHLRDFHEEGCKERVRPMLLGASNSWFPLRLSVLSIPPKVDPLAQLVEKYWNRFEECADARDTKFARKGCPGLEPYSDEEIWAAVQAKQEEAPEPETWDPELKAPEWEVFSRPDAARNGDDFRLEEVPVPPGFESYLERVVLAERLREVHALLGFTRVESPEEFGGVHELPKERRVPLCRTAPAWVPGVEVRGEGIFLQFREERVREWCRGDTVADRETQLFLAHQAWRRVRRIDSPDRNFPGSRYVLLHSFAHALMRQLSLECGYTASSIRERIYSREPEDEGGPMAGVLIYTAAPDSEGTLGGLVSLGRPLVLARHLDQALEAMRLCASDPLCAEHLPAVHGLDLHGASCHACLFAPETSCERGNRYLDRNLLVPTLASGGAAFFQPVEGAVAPAMPPSEPAPLSVVESGIPLVDLSRWEDGRPAVVGYHTAQQAGLEPGEETDEVFLARVPGSALDRLVKPGSLWIFRRLTPEDALPEPDSVVVVQDERLRDPELGPVTVRRLFWTMMTDQDSKPTVCKVSLRPRSTDPGCKTQHLDIPAAEWEGWRPYARFAGVAVPEGD